MLEGLVAAGYYVCFYKMRRGAAAAGLGVAVLALAGYLFPALRPALPVWAALWLMTVGFSCRKREGQELLLFGGVWLMARSLGGIWSAVQTAGGAGAVQLAGKGVLAAQGLGIPGTEGLQAALGTALFLMAALFLLGRGKIYPLWMGTLTVLWASVGFLGNISYAEPWQEQVMNICLYLGPGSILVWQQSACIRRELRRAEAAGDEPPSLYAGAWSDFGYAAEMGSAEGLPKGAEAGRNTGSEKPEESAGIAGWGKTTESGRTAGSGKPEESGSRAGQRSMPEDWREAADRELWRLRIFEHDFRHHLDILEALYEDGRGEEARMYVEDMKQSRLTRQGRRMGGEKELLYILMAKRQECRQADISYSYQIAGCPRGIAWMDMSALLLNLLDNAVRACGKVQGPRSIGIMLLSRGELWQIELVNSAETEGRGREEFRQDISGRNAGRQQNSTQNNVRPGGFPVHGIGMVSVRQIVEKYHGTYRMYQEEGRVIQKIILTEVDGED